MLPAQLNRRRFLASSGALAGTAGIATGATLHDGALGGPQQTIAGDTPWQEGAADSPSGTSGTEFKFFTPPEVAFIAAAVERLIPTDPSGPGAVEAGVPIFLDRQLAGPYGQGQHFFLGGPWPAGTPEQGYQSRFTPAQLYRAAIAAIDRYAAENFDNASFAKLPDEDRDKVLKALEDGTATLGRGVNVKAFFAMLLQNTKEGYFSDPIYGGNKDMAAWKMIGFPGAHYDYKEWVNKHGEPAPYPVVGFKGRPGWREG